MRRCLASFICVLLLAGAVSFAQAQSISCPEANVILTVPDSWTAVPLSASGDPDLRLLLDGECAKDLYTIREFAVKEAISCFLHTGEVPKPLAENSEMCIIYG